MSAAKLVNEYLNSFYSGDFDKAKALLSDDFHFKGPFVEAANNEAYFASAACLASIVRGRQLLRQWEDGEDVCSVYEVHLETATGTGSVLMSEWHTARHGELISGRLILDTAAFRALVPPR